MSPIMQYKCCRNKTCHVLSCIQCHSIWHGSCLERKIGNLESRKTLCSKNCEKAYGEQVEAEDRLGKEIEQLRTKLTKKEEQIEILRYEAEERADELLKEIESLTKQNKEKDVFIQTQRRQSRDFKDIAETSEEELLKEINKRETTFVKLNKELVKFQQKCADMEKAICILKEQNEKAQLNIEEFENTKTAMLTSIEHLSNKNCNFYSVCILCMSVNFVN
ncbi:unnamed protein product [Ceutorhynchus assimilis]|uniref:Uncharacterized protein n=1 Tax=Ceutorhynchus assimilis TaxID=467358 RepID=A0A9N9MAI1_9CUCU|nr:unnamed protein product [Ceutorhynchus assimilis]